MAASWPAAVRPGSWALPWARLFPGGDRLRDQQVVVRSSNYALYGDMSQRVMALLKQRVPELEVYSIDEAFAVCHPARR